MTQGWIVELPEQWQTAPFREAFTRVIAEASLPRGRSAVLVLGMLEDGTNVLALTWDRGQRIARVCPDTGRALEERFTGRPPQPGEGKLVECWRLGVQALVQAGRDAEAEMARPGWRASPAVETMVNPEVMDRAWELYCERASMPIDRALFELGVSYLAAAELEGGR